MAEVPLPTPTQAPVPSTDIRNAVFAGAKLDEEVTGTGEFYTDRLGVKRLTNTGRNNQFDAAQLDRANRFEQFLLSSGYVFLGDYEDGPFQFSARNQYIRYNNQYYRLNAATDVGFTTTGTDATSFVNDVTHFVLMDGDTLRQNLGSGEEGLGTDLIRVPKGAIDSLLTHWLHSPSIEAFGVTPGEAADYAANASGLNAAALWSITHNGAPVIIPEGHYYYSDEFNLLYDAPSNFAACFAGMGDTKSYLHPVGGDGTKPAISIIREDDGTSGSNSVRSAGLSGVYVESSQWNGDTIHLENVALWSVLENMQVWYSQGYGIYGRGVTECEFNNVEVRGCAKEGWLIYEPNTTLGDPKFVECSYNIFRRCKAFANNGYGVQGRFVGGNSYLFEQPKFSEGTKGMLFEGSKGTNIISPYFDGTTKISGSENIAVQFNGAGTLNNRVVGGRVWNCHVAVDLVIGDQSTVMDINVDFASPAGSSVLGVRVGAGTSLPVYTNQATAQDNTSNGWMRNFFNSVSSSFNPTFTVTTGTVNTTDVTRVGRQTRNGNRVDISCRYRLGAGSVLTGTNLTLTLPYATSLTAQSLAVAAFDASDNKYYHGRAFISGQGATVYFESVFAAYENSPATAYPFYPASGDWFQIEGAYLIK
ncbi:TPA: hypothetical protein QHT63_001307 [Klebsiella quasipneumoniae subsp. similipneumoniae]|nr:hypothetical protein [Klebsiella quasipneumoniae subsp. similipneumoniae]